MHMLIEDLKQKGRICSGCGVHLEKKEQVYFKYNKQPVIVPDDGEVGYPVLCVHCKLKN